jgi:hypothetical protein
MNTCLIHMQSYPLGSFCPYCGSAPTATVGSIGVVQCYHVWSAQASGGVVCVKCGECMSGWKAGSRGRF